MNIPCFLSLSAVKALERMITDGAVRKLLFIMVVARAGHIEWPKNVLSYVIFVCLPRDLLDDFAQQDVSRITVGESATRSKTKRFVFRQGNDFIRSMRFFN